MDSSYTRLNQSRENDYALKLVCVVSGSGQSAGQPFIILNQFVRHSDATFHCWMRLQFKFMFYEKNNRENGGPDSRRMRWRIWPKIVGRFRQT